MSPDHVIRRVAVIGTGTLGAQIAVMTAASGREVVLFDAVPSAAKRAFPRLRAMLAPPIARGELTWDLDVVFARMTIAASLAEAVAGVDLVIEAVREDLETKRAVFADISRANPAALLATNSSSIPCSQVADVVADPSRLVNLHFFTEFWRRSMVELMGNAQTSVATMRTMEAFGNSLGLFCAVCHGESKGFIINRVWRAVKREALRVVDEGHADPETVDRLWAFFWGTERGPFGAMDQVGLDVIADIEDSYIAVSPDPTDIRSPLLHELVKEGHLGEKAGKGFYDYPDPAYKTPGWPGTTTPET
ncbi:MAG TPA: 3-hydroxyacyl-CoA dehydrogenase family protein [Thermomicrobiales bacterium]|nr:3-hydroxyacyl-CoA dehydrogenase family protein [Thermomicrobiales bacterium]